MEGWCIWDAGRRPLTHLLAVLTGEALWKLYFKLESITEQENLEVNTLANEPPADPTKGSGAGIGLQRGPALSQEGSDFCQDTGCARGERRKHGPFHFILPG